VDSLIKVILSEPSNPIQVCSLNNIKKFPGFNARLILFYFFENKGYCFALMIYLKRTIIKILCLIALSALNNTSYCQKTNYGQNHKAGNYTDVGDAKIYYEVYGSGQALLLLHGDTFGYIDEMAAYIPLLSKRFKVIAVATRGHGKSEMGNKKFSYRLFAEDAMAILKSEQEDSAYVMGFSAGAITAYYLTAYYPSHIKKAVIMAGMLDSSGYKSNVLLQMKELDGVALETKLPAEVKSWVKLMPKPGTYAHLVNKLKDSWLQPVYIEKEKAAAILCPVLIVGGDRDRYIRLEEFINSYKIIPNSQLAIIPGSGHGDLITNPKMFSVMILPFLTASK
jgi:pimeloyl-ACP methyl ester carboxylesterase